MTTQPFNNNSYNNPYGNSLAQSPYGQVAYPTIGQPANVNLPYRPNDQYNPYVPQHKTLGGRIIEKDDEVTPNEVPMDGSIYLFPKSDYSCIQAKQWRNDGSGLDTIVYVPLMSDEQNVQEPSMVQQILERLDRIENTLNKQNRPQNNQPRKNQNGSYQKRHKEE